MKEDLQEFYIDTGRIILLLILAMPAILMTYTDVDLPYLSYLPNWLGIGIQVTSAVCLMWFMLSFIFYFFLLLRIVFILFLKLFRIW